MKKKATTKLPSSTEPRVILNLTIDTSETDPFLDASLLVNDPDADDTRITQILLFGRVVNDELKLARALGPLTPERLPHWVQAAAKQLGCTWSVADLKPKALQGLKPAQAKKLVNWLLDAS